MICSLIIKKVLKIVVSQTHREPFPFLAAGLTTAASNALWQRIEHSRALNGRCKWTAQVSRFSARARSLVSVHAITIDRRATAR